MQTKIVKAENVIELSKLVKTDEQLLEVQKNLRENNLSIELKKSYDPLSGWNGQKIILEGVDLSGNGYCYSTDKLMDHIKNHHKYLSIKETKEFKTYLKLKEKFKHIKI